MIWWRLIQNHFENCLLKLNPVLTLSLSRFQLEKSHHFAYSMKKKKREVRIPFLFAQKMSITGLLARMKTIGFLQIFFQKRIKIGQEAIQ